MIHQHAFGEFEFQEAGWQASFREYGADRSEKVFVAELHGGNVDGDGHSRKSGVLPSASLRAGLAHHPAANGKNEARIFGDGNELGGEEKTFILLTPAYQGFDTGDLPGFEIHLWLIVQDEFVELYGAAQPSFERLAVDGFEIHFRLEKLEIVSSFFLGVVHGSIGVLGEGVSILSVTREDTDADAATDVELFTGNEVRGAEGKKNFRGAGGGVFGVGDLGQQDNEFVATLAADGIGTAHRGQQAQGNGAKELVADGMS